MSDMFSFSQLKKLATFKYPEPVLIKNGDFMETDTTITTLDGEVIDAEHTLRVFDESGVTTVEGEWVIDDE